MYVFKYIEFAFVNGFEIILVRGLLRTPFLSVFIIISGNLNQSMADFEYFRERGINFMSF